MVFDYLLYGQTVRSNISLGIRIPVNRFYLLQHRFEVIRNLPLKKGLKFYHTNRLPGERRSISSFAKEGPFFWVRFHTLADFRISDSGHHIVCFPMDSTNDSVIQALFLNQVFPLTLTLKNHIVLHSSAVRIGQEAIAFLGNQGYGKSTLAAAFVRKGQFLVTDDALVMDPADQTEASGRPNVKMSLPELRLRPALIEQFWGKKKANQAIEALNHKRRAYFEQEQSPSSLPLGALFLIAPPTPSSPTIEIERIPPSESWKGIMENSFRLDLFNHTRMKNEFALLTELIDSVPIFRIKYPRKLGMLPKVTEKIFGTLQKKMRKYESALASF